MGRVSAKGQGQSRFWSQHAGPNGWAMVYGEIRGSSHCVSDVELGRQ